MRIAEMNYVQRRNFLITENFAPILEIMKSEQPFSTDVGGGHGERRCCAFHGVGAEVHAFVQAVATAWMPACAGMTE